MSKSRLSDVILFGVPGGHSARFLKLAVWTSLLFPAVGTAAPQGTQVAQEESKGATIKVSTRLVQASVVVEDKHGRPVRGLTKDDFAVFDDRQPQKIAVFSVTTNQVANAPLRPALPDTFANRIPGNPDVPPNAAVILLDGLNTEFTDQAFARDEVIKLLLQIRPQDRVALYTLGTELKILHDFSSDASVLLAALKQYKGQLSPSLSSLDPVPDTGDFQTGPSARDDLLGGFLAGRPESLASQTEAVFLWRERAQRTLLALLQIAYHLSSLPGRKTLIWVSGNFPLIPSYAFYGLNVPDERLLLTDDFKKAAQMLNSSTLVVYPVDAHGLTVTRPDYGNWVTMKTIAEQTGGKAFYSTNDLQGAIRKAIDESELTYELGYYPSNEKWDGRFHAIKVSVKGRGLKVRTRKGYLALAEPAVTPEARGALASHALTTLLEDDRLAVAVHVTATHEDQQTGRILSASVRIAPHELSLKQQDGVFAGMVDLMFIQLDRESKVVDMTNQRYLLNLLPATYERSAEEGFTLTKDVGIRVNATQLRVVLRDSSTGLAGAVAVPLEKYFPKAPGTSK